MADTVVGLEVTQDCVRAAEVKLSRHRPVLHRFGEVKLPESAARDSEVLDPGAVSDAIKRLWSTAKLSRRAKLMIGLNSWRVLVRDFSSPLTDINRIIESLPFETGDLLPLAVDQAAMDFTPTRVDGEGTHGLLVVAGAQTVHDLVGAVQAAGPGVDVVDLLAFGLCRLSARLADPGSVVAMVQIGTRTTTMAIAQGGVPLFIRMLPAEISPQPSGPAPLALRPTRSEASRTNQQGLEDLAARLRGTLDFYADRGRTAPVERVLISGPATLNDDFARMLKDTMGVPVERVDPASFVRIRRHKIAPTLMQDLIGTVALTLGGAR